MAHSQIWRIDTEYRSIDGWDNNLLHPDMNAADTPLMRHTVAAYDDGVSSMAGATRPNPRLISNTVHSQSESKPNSYDVTAYLWVWGQFLDHDIDLTGAASPAELAHIPVPAGDPWFDPASTGTAMIPFTRSVYSHESGTPEWPREQMNTITGWMDGSTVYGSDPIRAAALRTNDGTGRLKTSPGDLLPYNTEGFSNAGGSGPELFLAGDVRANENVALTAMHTLFVREHNRIADTLGKWFPFLDGDQIYQRARRVVGAEIQVITYEEFLPALLGKKAMPKWFPYSPNSVGTIRNEFSTGAYRFGHSLLTDEIARVVRFGDEIPAGNLSMAAAFFAPHEIEENGIESLLRGLSTQRSEDIDVYIDDGVRNFLFGPPGAGGMDLAALNIQRGRDHGLPAYNEARVWMGMTPAASFADISSDPEVQQRLAAVYSSPDEVDFWTGGLAEDHMRGALVGELFGDVLVTQFAELAWSDRFFYQRSLNLIDWLLMSNPRLGVIIRRNTGVGFELDDDVFHIQPRHPKGFHGQPPHPKGPWHPKRPWWWWPGGS